MNRGISLIKYEKLPENIDILTKIRYNDPGNLSKISIFNDKIKINFNCAVNAITPGQAAVFYENDDVIGGGIIC